MRWRVIVLGALTVVLATVAAFCVGESSALFVDGQNMYGLSGGTEQPSQKVMDAANRLFQWASALQQLINPLAIGAILCGLGVLVVLARRWQVREALQVRAENSA